MNVFRRIWQELSAPSDPATWANPPRAAVDWSLWTRHVDEFNDGRFVAVEV